MSADSRGSASIPEDLLRCPICAGSLSRGAEAHTCESCGAIYPIVDGTSVFVQGSTTEHDELDHIAHEAGVHRDGLRDAHKAAQSAWFDRTTLENFEIERPDGSPALYRYMLAEKFRRSVRPFAARLEGWTALTVCGGSGMDAEFLAHAGASVISSDISLGAATRVRERARRHGVTILPIVADVERLPFADRSIDVVYVHDGLHHLEDPVAGIAEMARVARHAVSINEPAQAAATAVAVRLNLALDREDAGNRVVRLQPRTVASQLEAAGFRVAQAERYAMYYRHVPGRLMAFLSRQPILGFTVLGLRLANAIAGRFGNKMSVVATR